MCSNKFAVMKIPFANRRYGEELVGICETREEAIHEMKQLQRRYKHHYYEVVHYENT